MEEWYSLDNAGKVFPAIVSSRMTTVYRVEAALKEEVDTAVLTAVLRTIMRRFPYFQVHLRKGFFWYYLEHTASVPPVLPDSRFPCEKILMKRRGVFLLRVRVFERSIAVEASHTLTDGFGALSFLRAVIGEYLHAVHGPIADWGGVFRAGQIPDPQETEDAFVRHYNHFAPPPRRMSRAFHLTDVLLPVGRYLVLTGVVSLARLKAAAAERGVTVNELLVAVLFSAFQDVMVARPRSAWKPIRLIVPLDLRRVFGSKTMRNFTLFLLPAMDPRLGTYGFEEIVQRVHHFMRMEMNERAIHADMGRNVRSEKNMLVRLVPRVIKDLLFGVVFFASGENAASSSISNLGAVSLPAQMARHVSSFAFTPATGRETRTNCGVIGFGDEVRVTFGRNVKSREIERLFFTRLVRLGVPVRIQER